MTFPTQQLVLTGLLFAGVWYVARYLYAMRQGILCFVRNFLVSALGMASLYFFAVRGGCSPSAAFALSALVAGTLYHLLPQRPRRIPQPVKRQVIARYERWWRRYDPFTDHIDHIVPFSRGGSHTPDNLRVVSKRKNLRKGAKLPKPSDWW